MDKTVKPEMIGNLREKEHATFQMSAIHHESNKKKKQLKKTRYGLRDGHNPLFKLDLDLYRLVH